MHCTKEKGGDKLESATQVAQVAHTPPARHATLGTVSELLTVWIMAGARPQTAPAQIIHMYTTNPSEPQNPTHTDIYIYYRG